MKIKTLIRGLEFEKQREMVQLEQKYHNLIQSEYDDLKKYEEYLTEKYKARIYDRSCTTQSHINDINNKKELEIEELESKYDIQIQSEYNRVPIRKNKQQILNKLKSLRDIAELSTLSYKVLNIGTQRSYKYNLSKSKKLDRKIELLEFGLN